MSNFYAAPVEGGWSARGCEENIWKSSAYRRTMSVSSFQGDAVNDCQLHEKLARNINSFFFFLLIVHGIRKVNMGKKHAGKLSDAGRKEADLQGAPREICKPASLGLPGKIELELILAWGVLRVSCAPVFSKEAPDRLKCFLAAQAHSEQWVCFLSITDYSSLTGSTEGPP